MIVARPCQTAIPIQERSQIGEARRTAARVCAQAGLGEGDAGRVAILTTELATNVLIHGGGGTILVQSLGDQGSRVIEVLAVDSGPGMRDLDRCMADGFSTGGTQGTGLGATRRQADFFDAWSHPGAGTVIVARVGNGGYLDHFGAVCLPYPGEQVCGDGWLARASGDAFIVMVVDGLGHGPLAATASDTALEAFEEVHAHSPSAILTLAHARMAATRGGAVAVAACDLAAGTLRYAAVGNISGALVHEGSSRGLVTQNGTVGAQIRVLRELEYPCPQEALLILHSDGVATRWKLNDYPALSSRHPALIAAVLHRDFCRGRDDATVVVARVKEPR
ncbi:MAG TPA: SpoIIE family protein phosphatase [Candidatus Binatia bacterium]|nr:SpoIIE family protein phosphatase [Candidatus Binatia bacterium]